MIRYALLAALVVSSVGTSYTRAADSEKPRLLVLTDIGGDPDDQQSMVRLLLNANEFEMEGLIASASGTPGELKEKVTRPELIRGLIEAYGKVYGNLAKHADGFPAASELLAKVKSGNPNRGRQVIGEGHDTEGSRWIIAAADKADERPLCVTIWGGQTDLAQALWRVRKDRGELGLKQFQAKLRVYDIADQDGIATWMLAEFPGMFYILAQAPAGRDKREGVFRGMYLGGDLSLVSREWMNANIRENHGPLGALYPERTWTAPNPHSATKEGDTPSWLYFLPHGVNDPAHPEWGGFGGRFERNDEGIYRDARDSVGGTTDARATVWRWRPAFQSDFQARLDWCVADAFEKANHAPRAVLQGDKSRAIVEIAAKSGETVRLSAEASSDPDKQEISQRWFVYSEAGTFREDVVLTSADASATSFVAPKVHEPASVHVVLEVTDAGTPRLSSFRRAVITVTPGLP